MNINRVIIGGNLSRDPEMRATPSGTATATFSIAVNRKFKGSDGSEKEEVSFIDCEAWSKGAELIAKYFTKGKPILVEGRLKQDSWDDKDTGKKRSRIKVVVDQFHFVGGKRDDAPPAGNVAPQDRSAPPPRPAPADGFPADDIPF